MHWQSLKREVQIIIIKINDSVTIKDNAASTFTCRYIINYVRRGCSGAVSLHCKGTCYQ